MASKSGTYVTVPMLALNAGLSTSGGTGMKISTLLAAERGLNCERALMRYSTRERPRCSMTASTQMSGFTCVFKRYDMSSNSPSGGMKEMVRSFSKRVRRTHW